MRNTPDVADLSKLRELFMSIAKKDELEHVHQAMAVEGEIKNDGSEKVAGVGTAPLKIRELSQIKAGKSPVPDKAKKVSNKEVTYQTPCSTAEADTVIDDLQHVDELNEVVLECLQRAESPLRI